MTHAPLPPLLVLTDRTQTTRPLVDVVRACVDGGARAVVLREKDLPRDVRARLADQLAAVLGAAGGLLLVASDPTIPADGVHLAASDPMTRHAIVGRSCHDEAELSAAAVAGCHYATLSPIFATTSKPGYGPALGSEALRASPLPTYALGGVGPDNAADCLANGAAGVAVLGTVMRAQHPERIVGRLLTAVEGAHA